MMRSTLWGCLAGDPKAVAIAEKALDDHSPEVREAAATTLGELHSSSSIPKLELALKDKDITVVLAAAHSLWSLQDKQAYEVYYEILLGERKAGPGLIAGQEAMFRDRKKLAAFAFEQGIEFNPFAGIGWGIVKASATRMMCRRCERQPREFWSMILTRAAARRW